MLCTGKFLKNFKEFQNCHSLFWKNPKLHLNNIILKVLNEVFKWSNQNAVSLLLKSVIIRLIVEN